MILQITVPAQETDLDDIEVENEMVIVGEVTRFYGYTKDDNSHAIRWGINPNGLHFSSFPGNFIGLVLEKYPHRGQFRLDAEYEYTDPDDGELVKENVVFKVTSVEEVGDFPSVSS